MKYYYLHPNGITVYILKGRNDALLLMGYTRLTEEEYLARKGEPQND